MRYKTPSLFQWWFWLITRFIGLLFIACIGCIVVSIVIVALRGEQSGLTFLHTLLQQDYQYLAKTAQPHSVAKFNHWLGLIRWSGKPTRLSLPMMSQHDQQHFWMILLPSIKATLLGIRILMVRLFLLLHWSSLFLLFGFVGLIDGLAQRTIRRVAAGRESTLVYHNAKALVMLSLMLGIFMDLLIPLSIKHMEWILVAASVFLGLAIQVTAKSFKKYI